MIARARRVDRFIFRLPGASLAGAADGRARPAGASVLPASGSVVVDTAGGAVPLHRIVTWMTVVGGEPGSITLTSESAFRFPRRARRPRLVAFLNASAAGRSARPPR